MNTITSFLVELALTLLACFLVVIYLRPFLRRILVDLCGTEERAQFWTVFSNILLIGLPFIFALGFRPESHTTEDQFFEVAARLGGNFGGFLSALVVIGVIVSFFALVAPKPTKIETK